MALTSAQRELVRIAARTTDPERRRELLVRLAGFLPDRKTIDFGFDVPPGVQQFGGPGWAQDAANQAREEQTAKAQFVPAPMSPFTKRMTRMAYATKDPVLRRGILQSIRVAGYPKPFMDAVKGQKFHNPSSGNKVLFVSLPPAEQTKVYEQWKSQKGTGPTLDDVKVTPEVAHAAEAIGSQALEGRPKTLNQLMQFSESGKPWAITLRSESSSGGKKWVARGKPDGSIEISFGPESGWTQSKPFTGSASALWKRAQKKLDKGYEHMGSGASAQYDQPSTAKGADLWKEIEKKFGGDPPKLAQAAKALITQLEGAAKKRPNLKLEDVIDSVKQRYSEAAAAQAKVEKKKSKPKKTEAEADLEEKAKIKAEMMVDDGIHPDIDTAMEFAWEMVEAEEEAKAKEEAKPKKTEAPKGKHKDRKELRAKPKKKMADSVKVSDELAGILIPEGMNEATAAQAKQQLGGANFGLLSSLRENAQHALDNPNGAYAKALTKAGYTSEGIRDMHTALSKALVPALGKKYHPDVLQVANLHDLESEDADDLAAFKGDKPARGKKLTPQELFNKFMAKAKPETKERMQGMPLNDFMAMYAAIMSEEDEDGLDVGGKTANRLPQEPHSVVQDALKEGIVAMDTENDILAGEDEDAGGISIFDPPSTVKAARLSDEDRALVRLAHSTSNPELRRRVLVMFRDRAS